MAISLTYLALNYRAVPRHHEDAPALMLLQALLSGQSGLLFNDMRDEQGLGYTVTALYRAMPEAGSLLFYIGTTPEKVDLAREGFARIIASLRDREVSPEQLQAAVNRAAIIANARALTTARARWRRTPCSATAATSRNSCWTGPRS